MYSERVLMSPIMSHIATIMSSEHPPPCHYYGQAFGVWKFYTKPMGLRIKQLRNAKGWTQEVLAAKSGVSRSQLAMIEAETRPANTLRLNAIAAALDVAPEDLFETDPRERRIVGILRSLRGDDADALLRIAEAIEAKNQGDEQEDQ